MYAPMSAMEKEALEEMLGWIVSDCIDHAPQRAAEALLALHRLREGVYGICVDCGARISNGWLLLKPEAVRCTECELGC